MNIDFSAVTKVSVANSQPTLNLHTEGYNYFKFIKYVSSALLSGLKSLIAGKSKDWNQDVNNSLATFASTNNFQSACGHEIDKPKALTQQSIIELALEISPKHPLKTTQIKKLSADGKFPGLTTIKRHFGGIQHFYEACGFTEIDTSRYHRKSER